MFIRARLYTTVEGKKRARLFPPPPVPVVDGTPRHFILLNLSPDFSISKED